MSRLDGVYEVREEMRGRHDKHPTYPLLPGDLLSWSPGYGWCKFAPGLAVFGFTIDETIDPVKPVEVEAIDSMTYRVVR